MFDKCSVVYSKYQLLSDSLLSLSTDRNFQIPQHTPIHGRHQQLSKWLNYPFTNQHPYTFIRVPTMCQGFRIWSFFPYMSEDLKFILKTTPLPPFYSKQISHELGNSKVLIKSWCMGFDPRVIESTLSNRLKVTHPFLGLSGYPTGHVASSTVLASLICHSFSQQTSPSLALFSPN